MGNHYNIKEGENVLIQFILSRLVVKKSIDENINIYENCKNNNFILNLSRVCLCVDVDADVDDDDYTKTNHKEWNCDRIYMMTDDYDNVL